MDQIDALIAAGADVNARARHGQAPLHLAAAAGSDAAVARLLGAGAALDAHDLSGWTPLHQAAHYAQEGAMRALLAAGASPCKKVPVAPGPAVRDAPGAPPAARTGDEPGRAGPANTTTTNRTVTNPLTTAAIARNFSRVGRSSESVRR